MSAFLALAPHKAGHLPIIIHFESRMEHQSNTRSLGTFERVHLVKDRDAVHGPQYASGRLSLIISLGAR
ncbi:hypothetical protein HBI42_226020 [Parastagonospora nodorum]|nr:hypothetical protein HBI42_226020 [Parastagonospora nodorum]